MALPLPFTIPGPVGGNFDEVAKQFPLRRRHMAVESAGSVGAAGQPAFQNGWVNFGAPWQGLRFWKDPMGLVHIEGLVKSGTVGAVPVFTLPAGFRPAANLGFATLSNGAFGSIAVLPNGEVQAAIGSNVSFSLNCSFRQEA